MKKTLLASLATFAVTFVLSYGLVAHGQTIPSVSPFLVDALGNITQRVSGTPVKINGNLTVTGTCTGCGGGGGTPGGLNLQVQYNNAGVFGGISGAVTNGTILNLTNPILGGATLTTSSVNGVTLTTGGSSSAFLNGAGAYTTPANTTLITSGLGISTTTSTGGAILVSNTGVLSTIAGTGIGVSGATGNVTISNTGVTSLVAGTNISLSGSTGAVTINSTGSGTNYLTNSGANTFLNTGSILQAPTIQATSTATSTFAGGIAVTGGISGGGYMNLGGYKQEGSLEYLQNGGSSFLGLYDANNNSVYYGITPQLPSPTGVIALGGFYNGLGIQGNSSNSGTPIFGVLNSTQTGSSQAGIGHAAFTVRDDNTVFTNFNTLDDGTGRMGIGTTTPFGQLSASTTSARPAFAADQKGTGAVAVFTGGNFGIGTTTPYGLLSVNANAIGTAPEFVVGSSTGTNLVVANSGFVGVGTSSPAAQFDSEANSNSNMILGVFRNYNAGTSAVTTFNVTNDAGSQFGLQIYSSTNNLTQPSYGGSITLGGYARLRASTAASGLIVGTGGGTPVVFITNDTEVGRFTSGGNLGIGTSSPYAQLSIGGGNLVVGAATAGGSIGDLFLPKLGVAAGSFLAVDPTGKVIATTTPSGSGSGTVGTGLLGQLPYYAANGTTLTATSSIFLAATGAVSNLNGDVFSEQASYVVSTTTQDGNFTSLQSAINALPSTGGLIDVRCGVYTLAATTSIKVANTVIQGEGNCTQFNFDGSVVYTAITPATDNLTGIQLKNFYIHQTNATFQGIGIDASNTPLITVNGIKIDQTATTTRIKDTKNESFYQRWENLDLRNNNSCIDIGGLPVNDNLFENIRCGPIAGGKGFGLFMTSSSVNGAQDNTFTNFDVEPIGAATGITAIYADNAVDDLFINPYVEGNATGWKLTANSQRVNFQGGEFLSNTTYTNAGSNNQWLGVDKEGVAFQLIQASSTIADVSGNDASTPSLSFIGNTNFAKTSNAIKIAFANSTDSGVPLLINNPGTGTTTQLVDTGTGNAFEVDDQTNDLTAFVINAAGQTSIATDTPLGTAVLTTNGGVYLHGLATGAGNGALCATTDGLVSFDSGANCITSTILSKYNIRPITGSQAQEVLDLHPVQYNYYSDGSAHYGFIAEDVAKIDPKLVIYAQEDTTVIGANGTTTVKKGQPLSIDYERYTGLLTAEVQLQEKQIQALKVGTMADYVKKSWYWYLVVVFAIYVVYNEWDKRRRK